MTDMTGTIIAIIINHVLWVGDNFGYGHPGCTSVRIVVFSEIHRKNRQRSVLTPAHHTVSRSEDILTGDKSTSTISSCHKSYHPRILMLTSFWSSNDSVVFAWYICNTTGTTLQIGKWKLYSCHNCISTVTLVILRISKHSDMIYMQWLHPWWGCFSYFFDHDKLSIHTPADISRKRGVRKILHIISFW